MTASCQIVHMDHKGTHSVVREHILQRETIKRAVADVRDQDAAGVLVLARHRISPRHALLLVDGCLFWLKLV